MTAPKDPMVGAALLNVRETDIPHYAHLGLTAKQSEFVSAFLGNGGNATAAAEVAGYLSPAQSGYELKNHPKVAAAIRKGVRATIGTRGVRMAWGVYEYIMTSESASLALKRQCAKHTLDLAFAMDREEAGTAPGTRKRPEDMSLAELQSFIAAAQITLNDVKDVTEAAHNTIEHQGLDDEGDKSGAETDDDD